jgi:hypothetical protein
MALTFDQITAITNKYYMPKFPQLVFDQNLVQKRLAAKGTKPSSGESIKQPIMYQMGKGAFFNPFDTFDISAEDQITAADFNWKYAEVPVTISRDEILKNKGPEGVKKLLDAKMKLAAMKMGEILSDSIFAIGASAGTDSSAATHCFDSICEDAAGNLSATSQTFGGIDKSDASYSWWAGKTIDQGGAAVGINYIDMCTFFYQIADGSIQPDLICMHNNSFATYMKDQQDQQRYLKQSELDAGFLTASFQGRTLVADLHVSDAGTTTEASNRVYMLNTDFIDFVTHADENNRLEPFAKPVDQAVGVAHIMWAGELTSSDCGRNGAMHNFDSLSAT